MKTFIAPLCLLAIASCSAASVVREDLNAKVDVLLNEGIQRQLDAHQRRENLTTFYLWDTAWGYWPSFVNGFVSGLGPGFRRDGDCSQEQGDHSRVSCRIVFSDLQLHYHITVAVKDKSLEETQQTMNPVLRADGGELVATVKNGRAVLMLRKNLVSHQFSAFRFIVDSIEVEPPTFEKQVVTAGEHTLQTSDKYFQEKLNNSLKFWLKQYLQVQTFLRLLNEAWANAELEGSSP